MKRFPGLVDSHMHLLSLHQKGLDPGSCLAEFFEEGGRWALDVAVSPHDWEKRLGWGEAFDGVYFTAGIHPSEANTVCPADLAAVESQLDHPRCLALGEIGLDWYRGRDGERAQRDLFRAQLALAQSRRTPVIIHNRDADDVILADLQSVGWSGHGVFHCFSSGIEFARRALDCGFFLSFAGNLTYPSSATLRDVAAWAPLDRLLVETDSPYLAPQGCRGKPNRPVQAGVTAQYLAQLRQTSLDEVLHHTGENFGRLFGLITGRE